MSFRRPTNFLDAKPHFRRTASWRWPLRLTLIAAAVLLVLAVVAAPFVVAGFRLYSSAMSGQGNLNAVQSALSRLDLTEAGLRIEAASRDFHAAKTQLVKLQLWSWIPPIGSRLDAAESLLDGGIAVTAAGRDLLSVGQRLLAVTDLTSGLQSALSGQLPDLSTAFEDLTTERKRAILTAVSDSVPELRQASRELELTELSLKRLTGLPAAADLLPTIEPLQAELVSVRRLIDNALPVAEILPAVLGFPTPRHYLLIFQNHTELRPTGGFLSLVGLLSVTDAQLQSVEVENVYKYDVAVIGTDLPKPPEPFQRFVGVKEWYLRDANWSPDFTVASQTIIDFWRREYAARFKRPAPTPDGIIAVTPKLAEDILRLTGPVAVGGKTFTADNLVDELEFQVEQDFARQGIPWEERKDIVNDLVQELVLRISHMPLTSLLQLLDVAHDNLRQGHVLLGAVDSRLQSLILSQDWGGALRSVDVDYLSVIDSNMASLKTDAFVDRSVSYAVDADGSGNHVGRVAVTYRNDGNFSWKSTRYRTYVRVYLPAGSDLIGATGQLVDDKLKAPAGKPGPVDVGDEFGRRWFGAFVSTEPGQSRTVEFRFKLAPAVVEAIAAGRYHLTVEKQPGTLKPGLTLDLGFGKPIASAVPAEAASDFGDDRYRISTDLLIDREFEVKFK